MFDFDIDFEVPPFLFSFLEDPSSILLYPFKFRDILAIVDLFVKRYASVPNLIDLRDLAQQDQDRRKKESFLIVGDIHGDMDSLIRILGPFLRGKVDCLIFMGDYVDRGPNSFEVLFLLLTFAIFWPDRIILLRGNHEDVMLNERFGFLDQFLRKIRSLGSKISDEKIIKILERIYEHLSLAAITPLGSLCIHAGIPKYLYDVKKIGMIPKPHSLLVSISDDSLKTILYNYFMQIRWNDSSEYYLKNPLEHGIHGYFIYTQDDVEQFLKKNDLNCIIKSHEAHRGGLQIMFGGKLIHIFSTEPYFGHVKRAYVIEERITGRRVVRNLRFRVVRDLNRKGIPGSIF